MAATISRARRAELARRGQEIRRRGQAAGWPTGRITAAICAELPQVRPLEAWRWAMGWSRAELLAEVAAFYEQHRLGDPRLNSSMLCRYEHGEITPGADYAAVLCAIYRAHPSQLGLHTPTKLTRPATAWARGYGYPTGFRAPTDWDLMTNDSALAALRESILLALEVDGPAGGPVVIEGVAAAISYYATNYSAFPPGVLAREVHQTRALVGGMLQHAHDDAARTELRRLAGWLSALVGNLAHHLGDHTAAGVHLATAARLGTAAGDDGLVCWALGAHSMVTRTQDRYEEALELGRQAAEHADTPLRRAQIAAWAVLPAAAALGDRTEAARLTGYAQDQLAADSVGEQAGRFGFDLAELHLHLAEAELTLGEHEQARTHARMSAQHTTIGRPGWAAATLVLARAEVARGRSDDAAALAGEVLDAVPAPALRETSRVRLHQLDRDLHEGLAPGREPRDLRDRIRVLPALAPVSRSSPEPNGI